ncbi:MAG: hypothetical protein GTO55_00700 [Armatimonadetes bacterium]|nr:hypothetical protein [Armatimonadota bacterium]NIM22806.1 hypothetical protein [Armatimonadota bacterium]NIM66673.1 hypothetical protein [Armatimonadota bacterium]NIM75230.1 hypothetical protein [Armatimonadota bacterium]NIN04871.1 hypothetical protein [Armatimonadota bacterium]
MGWCPKCGYEYRPEVRQCPKCQVSLVAEKPPIPPPTIAGWRVEEKTLTFFRCFSGAREGLQAGFQVARQAARITFRAKRLLLVVFLMITVSWVGEIALARVYRTSMPEAFRKALASPPEETSLGERWSDRIHQQAPLSYLQQEFNSPLSKASSAAHPWLDLFTSPLIMRQISWDSQKGLSTWDTIFWLWLFPLWDTGITLAVGTLILVGLLVWLLALARGTRPSRFRDSLKSHYLPVFVILLLPTMAIHIVFAVPQTIQYLYPLFYDSDSTLPLHILAFIDQISRFIAYVLFSAWVFPLALLLLTLAPFAIVDRNLGAWGGVKAGVRILWQKRWAFLASFICYRLLYELIYIARLALPTRDYRLLAFFPSSIAFWPIYLAFGFLGLWLAMTFALLITSAKEPAPQNPA